MNKLILAFLLGIIIIGGAFFAVARITERESYKIITGKETVIKQIRSLNKWETTSFTVEKVIDAGTAGTTFNEFLFGDRILLIAHGEVIAGFDLSRMGDDALQVTGDTVTVQLPPAEIFFVTLDNDQSRVYDRRQGLLTKGDKDLESEARAVAEVTIRQAACDGGILQTADENGRKQMTALLKSLGFITVVINSSPGSCG